MSSWPLETRVRVILGPPLSAPPAQGGLIPVKLRYCLLLLTLMALAPPLHAATEAEDGLRVCVNYGCKAKQNIPLQGDEWKQVETLFSQSPSDAAEERRRIGQAVGLMERHAGGITGTSADRGRNNATGAKGQLDCIAESTNSDRYLRLFEAKGWLKWHGVGERVKRSPWIFDVHWTAVIEERPGGKRYAVDSWFFDNGHPAHIQPLEDWFRKLDPP